jgi:hypothetical protein
MEFDVDFLGWNGRWIEERYNFILDLLLETGMS